ncbi:MAG: agmatinase [Aigarchaeota archaeon]|nr:agmatinase [Aigarchaeota archaeon]MDW8092980.1 agmatinase [Nitrososphaerota archaeon]
MDSDKIEGRQVDSTRSPRFSGVTTFARLPHTKDLSGVESVFMGIPFDDGTVFRSGARFGPKGVREGSLLLRPYNPVMKVRPFEVLRMVDYGDLDPVPGYIEETFGRVEAELTRVMRKGLVPLICGGDHSITLPVLRSFNRLYGKLKLIHVDAHADCWDKHFGMSYGHGTVFRRASEEGLIEDNETVHIGLRGSLYSDRDLRDIEGMGHRVITMDEVESDGIDDVITEIERCIGSSRSVYVSFDIDSCDPSIAPGTGTPEVGGLTTREVMRLIRGLVRFKIVGFDLVEVSPPYDVGGITSLLAANIFYEVASVIAVSKGGKDFGT